MNTDKSSEVLVFYVNGKKIVEENVNPEWTLLIYLRTKLALCGTKLGCGEGGCGACTVMVSKYNRSSQTISHYPVNACLTPVCSMHGLAVTTVEGIGSTKTKLHPVQERIAKAHGTQCGFCTPGIVMSMYALLRNQPKPKMEDLDVAFQGNLCRCTGYRPIIEGYKTFTEDWELMQAANGLSNGKQNGCAMGDQCCKLQNGTTKCNKDDGKLFEPSKFVPYDSTQEPIFPPELKLTDVYDKQTLSFKNTAVSWYRPTSLVELVGLLKKYPGAKIIGGNTEVGVEVRFKAQRYPVLIQPTAVKELTQIEMTNAGARIGAGVTFDNIEKAFKTAINLRNEYETRAFKAIVEMLHWFAGKQIRSVATVGGNIMTGSPISDLNPILMALGVNLHLRSASGSRTVKMDDQFYTGYRRNIVRPDEILEAIEVPFTNKNQFVFAHKQSRRRDDDIAIVNSAINLTLSEGPEYKIKDINVAFGGMAPTTILAKRTKALVGQNWDEKMLETAYQLLLDDLPLPENVPGGMVTYRRSLAICFFFRTYLNIAKELNLTIDPRNLSALDKFTPKPPKSSQLFQVSKKQHVNDRVGQPIVHTNAFNHATGEAVYNDDIPILEKELHMSLIYSKKSHAKILSVDLSKALEAPNVVSYIRPEDIRASENVWGLFKDEQLMRVDTVTSQYQILGGILATDQLSAKQAVNLVKVEYEELKPIITIEQAIEAGAFYQQKLDLKCGNSDEAFAKCQNVVTGESRTGYQEHFYLEPPAFLAVPKEGDEIEIYSCSQDPSGVSERVAKVLGMDQNKVNVRVKRIGGAFGGKEPNSVKLSALTSVAARKTNRPVRLVLERDEDMGLKGGRNAFLVKYKLGFGNDGKIHAAEIEIYLNGGYSLDTSAGVCVHAATHITNSAKIENVKLVARVCQTNLPSNGAMRGFGIPQANFVAECMLRSVAEHLKMSYVDVARLNLYSEGDKTIYGQPFTSCNIRRCFEEVLVNSDYVKRKQEIEEFNKQNRWKKRGIDIVTTTYGVGFGVNNFQQGLALVLIYKDGSVLLHHGGVEMGQGLHTKMIQVASRALNIPMEKIHTTEASTYRTPNVSVSAASMSSDLNGMAIIDACNQLNERLKPIKEKLPNGTWQEWATAAHTERISLSANGFYREPLLDWDFNTNTGSTLHSYHSYGASVTEVEVDCLTGDHRILRTDIVMDLGNSLNPAIDIGQVEGGYMQGYGLYCLEEMVTLLDGTFVSKGPGAYKIPGFGDIPIEFNVALLKNSSNPRAVYSSKAIGEPPFFLACSALFAIREAIKAARRENGVEENFQLNAPATAEKIRMACQDPLVKKVKPVKSTWNIQSF